jgi:putative lipoic acid-binding regulatory protein
VDYYLLLVKTILSMSDKNAFYEKLKSQLDDTTEFPADYMYKFIVPTDENQLEEVQNLFDNKGAVIKTKKSKTGKYISLTIVLKLQNATEVIGYYKKAEKIKGIISL